MINTFISLMHLPLLQKSSFHNTYCKGEKTWLCLYLMTEAFEFVSLTAIYFHILLAGLFCLQKEKIFNVFQVIFKLEAKWEMFPQMFLGIHKSRTSKIMKLFEVLGSAARTTQDKSEKTT